MSFNTIDNISAGGIASIISNNMLEHLNLNDRSLRDHAVVAIADALVKINSLVYLNFGNNCITQQTATKIGNVIYSNHTIRELHLHNCLRPDTSSVIFSVARQKSALKCLNLNSNIITPFTEGIIASVVELTVRIH